LFPDFFTWIFGVFFAAISSQPLGLAADSCSLRAMFFLTGALPGTSYSSVFLSFFLRYVSFEDIPGPS